MEAHWVLTLLVVLGFQAARCSGQTKLESGLLAIVEKLKHGDTDLPFQLPSLRPLKLEPLSVQYHGLRGEVSEISVKGLQDLKVEALHVSERDLTVQISVSLPGSAVATADEYHLQAPLGFFSIDDRGKLSVKVDNLRASATVQLAGQGYDTGVRNLDLDFTADVEVNLSGSGDIVNEMVNSMVRELIADESSFVHVQARDMIISLVNRYLKGHTPEELIRLAESQA